MGTRVLWGERFVCQNPKGPGKGPELLATAALQHKGLRAQEAEAPRWGSYLCAPRSLPSPAASSA